MLHKQDSASVSKDLPARANMCMAERRDMAHRVLGFVLHELHQSFDMYELACEAPSMVESPCYESKPRPAFRVGPERYYQSFRSLVKLKSKLISDKIAT
ncbi:hypothetical protein TWF569_007425 [Orbilia oligospora]|nr:hypothetical protein TWF569_007425 [Orbilia oligospora]